MKAIAVTPLRREVALIEAEAPQLAGPTDVMLRILDVGICGTDREIARRGSDYRPAGPSPRCSSTAGGSSFTRVSGPG
jgi:threonine dehydrogenase-like Zn-dependent dehydrogenase